MSILTTDAGGQPLEQGKYDLNITVTSGTASIERSIDNGANFIAVTDASWTATATAILRCREALYRANITNTAAIDIERIKDSL